MAWVVVVLKSSTIAQNGVEQRFIYLFTHSKCGDPQSSVCAGSWELNPAKKKMGPCTLFIHTLPETMPQLGQCLKCYWLKEFPQLFPTNQT